MPLILIDTLSQATSTISALINEPVYSADIRKYPRANNPRTSDPYESLHHPHSILPLSPITLYIHPSIHPQQTRTLPHYPIDPTLLPSNSLYRTLSISWPSHTSSSIPTIPFTDLPHLFSVSKPGIYYGWTDSQTPIYPFRSEEISGFRGNEEEMASRRHLMVARRFVVLVMYLALRFLVALESCWGIWEDLYPLITDTHGK